MNKEQFRELKDSGKQASWHISTAYVGPTGPVVQQNEADLAPRVKDLTDRIKHLEGKV